MQKLLWVFLFAGLIFRISFYQVGEEVIPNGAKIRITDRVSSEPVNYTDSQYVNISGYKIYLPSFPEIHYGDAVVIEGVVDGGKLKNAKLVEVSESTNLFIGLRNKLLAFYSKSLPSTHAALVSGVTIGSKSGISSEFWTLLKNTGTLHVVVASGMNVTLVASFLIAFLTLFLSRKVAIIFTLGGVWIYAFMSGFDAPIIRAAIMGSLVFTAQGLGRISDAMRSLFLSFFFMLLLKPEWLWDLGFILSFVATLSLMLFESKVYRLISFVPTFFREGLSTSLAAQVGVAPILFYTFGQLNFLSPVINALVLWTIAPISLIGMLGGLTGIIFEPLGKVIVILAYPLTGWFIAVVNLFY